MLNFMIKTTYYYLLNFIRKTNCSTQYTQCFNIHLWSSKFLDDRIWNILTDHSWDGNSSQTVDRYHYRHIYTFTPSLWTNPNTQVQPLNSDDILDGWSKLLLVVVYYFSCERTRAYVERTATVAFVFVFMCNTFTIAMK